MSSQISALWIWVKSSSDTQRESVWYQTHYHHGIVAGRGEKSFARNMSLHSCTWSYNWLCSSFGSPFSKSPWIVASIAANFSMKYSCHSLRISPPKRSVSISPTINFEFDTVFNMNRHFYSYTAEKRQEELLMTVLFCLIYRRSLLLFFSGRRSSLERCQEDCNRSGGLGGFRDSNECPRSPNRGRYPLLPHAVCPNQKNS